MALRIEKAFGVSMDTLMRMQNSCDISQTRKRAEEIKVAPYLGKPAHLRDVWVMSLISFRVEGQRAAPLPVGETGVCKLQGGSRGTETQRN
jgi:hypothetical protein